jgi:hypothetical protein
MLPRRKNRPAREGRATSLAVVRQPAEPERLTLADYAAAMESLACLASPGAVQRLLERAEAEGVSIPDDLA